MKKTIPVIDIFAGPGGLGEGFSSLELPAGKPIFRIKLSIEMDRYAHKTLELRAFYRQFKKGEVPVAYYQYLKGEITRDELFKKHSVECELAKQEAWLAELGKADRKLVRKRIKDALGGADSWVLIGGPPCQAYSLVGRSRMIGENPGKYETDPRHLLYREYLHILADHRPPVFVMENVKGLLSAKLKHQNTIDLILTDLRDPSKAIGKKGGKSPSYRLFSVSKPNGRLLGEPEPEDFIVRSEDHGIPQSRHRIIILGIRSDIFNDNPKLLTRGERVPIEDVIDDLPKLRSGLSKEMDGLDSWQNAIRSIGKAEWMGELEPLLRKAINKAIKEMGTNLTRGCSFMKTNTVPAKYKEWYVDKNLGGVCNHETRTHLTSDLHRYFFASVYAEVTGKSPTLRDFPTNLLPNHDNVKDALTSSKFNDRFRVQVSGRPSTTVVSHISKDGHYYIHYDPTQCRSLTVREAARLQTFPDNYFFEGNRTQQYHQVGNAVPPLLAYKIAEIVFNVLKDLK